MPTITSSSTSAALRRARRHKRQIRNRSRALAQLRSGTKPSRRHSAKRQLQNQAAFDLEDRFDHWYEQEDSDVKIGRNIGHYCDYKPPTGIKIANTA